MKIIDAYWEKRNLGFDTTEILIEDTERLSDIDAVLKNFEGKQQYIVIKTPVGRLDITKLLIDNGFYFVESLIEVQLKLSDFLLSKNLMRFDDLLTYKRITTEYDFIRLEKEIKKGVFTTDRIALDANFGVEVAATRYFNWLKDEFQRGGEIFEILHKESPIGFFALKNISEGKYDNFLAGIYKEMFGSGLGFSILSKPIEELIMRQAKFYTTHVSSNNFSVLKLYFSMGFAPSNIVYVFTKTNK